MSVGLFIGLLQNIVPGLLALQVPTLLCHFAPLLQ